MGSNCSNCANCINSIFINQKIKEAEDRIKEYTLDVVTRELKRLLPENTFMDVDLQS